MNLPLLSLTQDGEEDRFGAADASATELTLSSVAALFPLLPALRESVSREAERSRPAPLRRLISSGGCLLPAAADVPGSAVLLAGTASSGGLTYMPKCLLWELKR